MKVLIFNRLCPANELFSGLDRPGSRPPSNAGKGCATGKSHIFEMIANNLRVSKVMKLVHKTVVKWLVIGISNHLNPDRVKVCKIALNGFLNYLYFWNCFFNIIAVMDRGRIIKQTFSMEGQKDFSADHIFESTIGLSPVPFYTQDFRNLSSAFVPMLINNRLDKL